MSRAEWAQKIEEKVVVCTHSSIFRTIDFMMEPSDDSSDFC